LQTNISALDEWVSVLPSGAHPDSDTEDDNLDYHTADEDDGQEVVNMVTREGELYSLRLTLPLILLVERALEIKLDVSVQTDSTNAESKKEENAVPRELVQPIRPPAAIQPGTARLFLDTVRELNQEAIKISQNHNKLVGMIQSIKQGVSNAIQREQDRHPPPNRPKGLRESLQKLLFPAHKAPWPTPSQSMESPLVPKEELPDVKLEIQEDVPQIKIKDEELPLDLSALDANLFPTAPSSEWRRSSSHPCSDPSDSGNSDPETMSPKRKRSASEDEEDIESSKRRRTVGPRPSSNKGKAKAAADESESEDDIVAVTPQEREAADLRRAIELSRESHRAQQLLEHHSASAADQLAAEIPDVDRYGHLPQYRYEKLKKEFDDVILYSDAFDRLSAEDQAKVTEMISSLEDIHKIIVNTEHYEAAAVVRVTEEGCEILQSVLETLE
jgi:hypothetical protein